MSSFLDYIAQLRICWLAFVVAISPAVYASSLTDTYLGDARPRALYFFTLVEVGDSLTGTFVEVRPNEHGSTSSANFAVTGSAKDGFFVLKSSDFFDNRSLSGKVLGRRLSLSLPMSSGMFQTLTLLPATEHNFNALLGSWRNHLKQEHVAREDLKSEQELEHSNLNRLAQALADDIAKVNGSGIERDTVAIRAALGEQHKALAQLEADLGSLTREAGVRPMTCYQAMETVGYAFNQTMRYTFEKTLGYASRQYTSSMASIEKRLANSDSLIERTLTDAVALRDALKVAKFSPRPSVFPVEANAPLKRYKAVLAEASERLVGWRGEHDMVLSAAREKMREGREIMQRAQGSLTCR